MKLYVTCLNSYNCGFLVGSWIDMDITEEDLQSEINNILEEGKKLTGDLGEEVFITDYEQEHNIFEIHEYSSIFDLREKYEEVSLLDEDDMKKVAYLMEHVNLDYSDAISRYSEVVIYEDTTLEQIVEQHLEETVDFSVIPEIISQNINYESIARDWEISGEYESIENDIYYFVN